MQTLLNCLAYVLHAMFKNHIFWARLETPDLGSLKELIISRITKKIIKLIIKYKPKNLITFLNSEFKNISYRMISKQNLHSQEISNHVAILAKNKKVREIVNKFQKKIIKNNKRICVEGRDNASKILAKSPRYDLAFYFKCNLKVASYRRWLDIKKKVPLKDVLRSLSKRTLMDKKRKNSPLIKVKDAILIRTDKLSKKEVLLKMSKYVDRLN